MNYHYPFLNARRLPRKTCARLRASLGIVCFGLAAASGNAQPSQLPDPKFWTPDGPVNAIVVTNDTVYLGGDFLYVGPRTGPAGLFDSATGQLLGSPPRIAGNVRAVVPDGNGGWFIGGAFTKVGDRAITNVAHLRPDLSLDPGWNAQLVGTAVNALTLDNERLYLGGQFTRIHGQSISGLAGLDATDASVVWNPSLSGSVNALRLSGNLLYVGGNFFSVGSSNVQNLAAISIDTALAIAWNPAPDQAVLALEVSGNTVYVGGQFTTIGTRPRNRLAALDAAGVATTWNPNPNGIVRALAFAGTSVYVGGDFTTIGGQNRRGFGAVNAGNGAAQALNLNIQTPGTPANLVRTILLQGNSLYVGGSFTNALGGVQRLLAGVDLPSGQPLPVPLASDFNGSAGAAFGMNAMAGTNGWILAVGDFQTIGGVERHRAAALSLTTGAALPWAPAFSGSVLSLAYGTNRIYAGGSFTNVNETNMVRGLAALHPTTGQVIPFNFQGSNQFADVIINAMVVTSNRLFVGGAFTAVSDQPRRFLAAIDPANAALISAFNARLGGGFAGVSALTLVETNLFVAGDFTTVNLVSIPRLTAVSANDGVALNWTPQPNQPVLSMAATPDNLYVGGTFSQIGGVAFRNFAGFSLADLSLLGVDAALPQFSQGVSAVAATPTTLYVGGSFDSIGGEFRLNLGCLASFNASSYDWDPAPDVPPVVAALTDNLAFIGGPFRFLGRSPTNRVHGFLAVFPRGPRILSQSLTPARNLRLVATTGDRTDCVLQATPDLGNAPWTPVATNDVPGFFWTIEVPTVSPAQRFFRAVAR